LIKQQHRAGTPMSSTKVALTGQSVSAVPVADTLEQRLQRLERLLGGLAPALVARSETAVDLQWREHDGGSGTEPPAIDLARLAADFRETLRARDRLRQAQPSTAADTWSVDDKADATASVGPLLDLLFMLAHAIADRPARTIGDIEVKALALREFCEEKSDDIVHRLAGSLAADLLDAGR
jgi:hypothetical protein